MRITVIALAACIASVSCESSRTTRSSDTGAPTDSSPGRVIPLDSGKAPVGCVWDSVYECFDCGASAVRPLSRRYLACSAPNDCRVFCDNDFPPEFVPCTPTQDASWCRDWHETPPRFEACTAHRPTYYSCPCVSAVSPAIVHGRLPDGRCVSFANTCVPRGLRRTGCTPLEP